MKNKELIDYCNSGQDCKFCPYDRKECDLFIKVMGYSPWSYTKNDEEFLNREVGETEGDIERFPTADVVEVKHGHWELDGTCSVCGKHTLQSYGNFCCYCGADMREQEESE